MWMPLALPLAAMALGVPADRPHGTLVIVSGDEQHLIALDLASGSTRRLHARWLGVCAPPPFVIGGMLVGQAQSEDGRRGYTFAIDPALGGRPRDLGRSWFVLPSATEGRVWLAGMPRGRSQRLSSLREVTADGRTTFVSGRPPMWNVTGAVDEGLILGRGRHSVVWDPRTGRVRRRLPGSFVMASRGHRIAWCGRKACMRAIRITDLGTGRLTLARGPRGWTIEADGPFSPDGTRLATTIDRNGREARLAIADARTGAMEQVPAGQLGYSRAMTWSSDGRWLIWSTGRRGLMAYRPDSGAPPVRLGIKAPRALALAAAP